MPIVANMVRSPAGTPAHGAVITIALVAGDATPGFVAGETITGVDRITTGTNGEWSVTLTANADILPVNTHYRITELVGHGVRYEYTIAVPSGGGPYDVRDVLVAPIPPDPLLPVGGEVASVDGRTGVVTLADRYAPLVHAARHASGGADELTLAQSQVTSLVADLAGKSPTSHGHTNLMAAFTWNGSAYVAANGAGYYVGPNDPGSVPDGSVWDDTGA